MNTSRRTFLKLGLAGTAAFSTATDNAQSLVPPRPQPENGFAADHHCAFWDSLRR